MQLMTEYKKLQKKSLILTKIETQKSINTIILNVKIAYYNYLLSEDKEQMVNQLLIKHESKLNLAKRLFRMGQRPILDVSRAKVGFFEAKFAHERAKLQKKVMRSKLYSAIGIPDTDIELILEDIKELPDIKYSVGDLIILGNQFYPDLKIIQMHKKIKKIQITVENARRYPSVDLTASFGFQNKQIRGSTLDELRSNFYTANWESQITGAFRMSFPILDGGAISAKVDSATSEYNKLVYQEKSVKLKLKSLLQNHFNNLTEFKKQVKMANVVIENANKHLLLASKSYQNGIGSQLDLQDAQLSVITARLNYLKTKYNYMITLSNISSIVGIGEKRLCKIK